MHESVFTIRSAPTSRTANTPCIYHHHHHHHHIKAFRTIVTRGAWEYFVLAVLHFFDSRSENYFKCHQTKYQQLQNHYSRGMSKDWMFGHAPWMVKAFLFIHAGSHFGKLSSPKNDCLLGYVLILVWNIFFAVKAWKPSWQGKVKQPLNNFLSWKVNFVCVCFNYSDAQVKQQLNNSCAPKLNN